MNILLYFSTSHKINVTLTGSSSSPLDWLDAELPVLPLAMLLLRPVLSSSLPLPATTLDKDEAFTRIVTEAKTTAQ